MATDQVKQLEIRLAAVFIGISFISGLLVGHWIPPEVWLEALKVVIGLVGGAV